MIFILLSLANACKKYECVILGSDICAKRAENSILVNSSPCSAGKRCLVSSLEDLETSSLIDTLYCEEYKSYSSYAWTEVLYKCGTQQKNRDFQNKSSLIPCEQDTDCILQDESYTTCQCGADGLKYCVPAWDSTEFAEYWSECTKGISRTRLDFWILFKQFYALWKTSQSLECIKGTIHEIQLMASYEKSLESFGRLKAFGGFLIFILGL